MGICRTFRAGTASVTKLQWGGGGEKPGTEEYYVPYDSISLRVSKTPTYSDSKPLSGRRSQQRGGAAVKAQGELSGRSQILTMAVVHECVYLSKVTEMYALEGYSSLCVNLNSINLI